MSPFEANDPAGEWSNRIQDVIADNSGVREGLHDDEAIPLMDWGSRQADHLSTRWAAPDTATPDQETVDNAAYALVRLMTRITWVVVYRHKKDAAWLTRTFHKINDLSRELYGADAPTLSDDAIAAWIAEHENHTNGELVRDLIARMTPSQATAPTSTPDDPPGSPPASSQPSQGDTPDEQTL